VTLWLGAISYPLYLLHRNLGYRLLFALHARGVPSALAVCIGIAFALALATAVNRLVERPAMTAIRKWYKARSPKSTAQPTAAPAAAG
jgi:peptidoglycan/LPS O-acetylase OafA/YrhL